MSTDWRALCAELTDALASTGEAASGTYDALVQRARAALAEPVGEGPTDEELDALVKDHCWDPTEWIDYRAFARAVLARYGHQPAPPVEGEVGELIEGLKLISDGMDAMGHESDSWFVARAADLLSQRHPAPVLVAERLPGPGDCDAEGRCWVHQPHEACPESPAWELMLAKYASPNYGATCWLPAHALPLPAGEVEP